MRVLIIPLSARADTAGSYHRVNGLVKEFIKAGIEVATCAALDCNYKNDNRIKNYYLPVPSPLGMPECIGKNFFAILEKSRILTYKTVRSFDEILNLTGAISKKYFMLKTIQYYYI